MIRIDRDALLCDLAETYGIYDMRALPASTLATLAVGLREDSRIKMRLSGNRVPRNEVLLAAVLDRLSLLIRMLNEKGFSITQFPPSVLDAMLGRSASDDGDVEGFDTSDEFEQEWTRATGVSHGER